MQMSISTLDIAWAAGFIEGEGYFARPRIISLGAKTECLNLWQKQKLKRTKNWKRKMGIQE
jgi:hypothetical protein